MFLLTVLRLGGKPEDIASIYTFGSPKVGDQQFATVYNSLLKDKTFRIVNHRDIVTTLPPFTYKQVGTKVMIDYNGYVDFGGNKRMSDHFLRIYCRANVLLANTAFLYRVKEHFLISYIYNLVKFVFGFE